MMKKKFLKNQLNYIEKQEEEWITIINEIENNLHKKIKEKKKKDFIKNSFIFNKKPKTFLERII